MKNFKLFLSYLVALLFLLTTHLSTAQKNTNARAQWFTEARFGMFIHWGVYSGAEGIWKGEKLRYDNDYAEWIYYRNQINRSEYTDLLKRFDWDYIDPEEWVLLAKKAGMKYVTITAKHHDGFALWDSKATDYDIAEFTSPKRDIIAELASACKKHGIKLGLYYSHWVDWEHENGWDHSKEIYGVSKEDYDQYWQEKVMPQMKELLTNYGDIGIIWFDMWIHHSKSIVSKEQLLQLKNLIRELQPSCLINSRLGLSMEEDNDIDFKTLGDNELGARKEDFPWQSPATVAHSWGFHALEEQWKSSTTLIHSLVNNVSLNGNLMLNIGPRADGNVPFEIQQRLLEMGNWLDRNGTSIYGSEAFDLPKNQHDWGKITVKKESSGKTKLYLHIYNWPLNKKLPLTGIQESPENAYLLSDRNKKAISFIKNGVFTLFDLKDHKPDPYVSVLVLEFDTYPSVVDDLVSRSVYGGYSLNPTNNLYKKGDLLVTKAKKFGSIPQHIEISQKSTYAWKIYIEKQKTVDVDVAYSFQSKNSKTHLKIKGAGSTLNHKVKFTGQTVGEPNSNWHIDAFKSHRIGSINFAKPGFYEILLEVEPSQNEALEFQWIWLNEN